MYRADFDGYTSDETDTICLDMSLTLEYLVE